MQCVLNEKMNEHQQNKTKYYWNIDEKYIDRYIYIFNISIGYVDVQRDRNKQLQKEKHIYFSNINNCLNQVCKQW